MLTAADMPEGAQVMPMDAITWPPTLESMTSLIEDATYEPADCEARLGRPDAARGRRRRGHDGLSGADFFMHAVYAGASGDDLAAIEEFYERCGDVASAA